MGFEIERKFLVHLHKLQIKSFEDDVLIKQGYLCQDPKRIVRIRKKNNEAFLTIKGENKGATRLEMEYKIPIEDADPLFKICLPELIEKKRYYVKKNNHVWEIDCFLGANQGLWIAEIELSSEQEVFEKPDWIGIEVTSDYRYSNSYLSQNPYSTWKEQ